MICIVIGDSDLLMAIRIATLKNVDKLFIRLFFVKLYLKREFKII